MKILNSHGMEYLQYHKNIKNLHNTIYWKYGENSLEVSTKSDINIGIRASVFNLKLNNYFIENIFQAAKVYEAWCPYFDILEREPKEAKSDTRHKTSGSLKGFYYGLMWKLEPKTVFYDYIYVKALCDNINPEDIMEYTWFTDIEFNPKKSINCQARAIVLAKLLFIDGMLNIVNDIEKWEEYHSAHVKY